MIETLKVKNESGGSLFGIAIPEDMMTDDVHDALAQSGIVSAVLQLSEDGETTSGPFYVYFRDEITPVTSQSNEDNLLTYEEVMAVTGLPRRTLFRRIERERITVHIDGRDHRRRLIEREDIDRLVMARPERTRRGATA